MWEEKYENKSKRNQETSVDFKCKLPRKEKLKKEKLQAGSIKIEYENK